MVGLLEANQTKDGNVVIPEVLRSYTGFDEIKKEDQDSPA
jgi:seryl-tRNA synthetase